MCSLGVGAWTGDVGGHGGTWAGVGLVAVRRQWLVLAWRGWSWPPWCPWDVPLASRCLGEGEGGCVALALSSEHER